jgi:hypothetical protein
MDGSRAVDADAVTQQRSMFAEMVVAAFRAMDTARTSGAT